MRVSNESSYQDYEMPLASTTPAGIIARQAKTASRQESQYGSIDTPHFIGAGSMRFPMSSMNNSSESAAASFQIGRVTTHSVAGSHVSEESKVQRRKSISSDVLVEREGKITVQFKKPYDSNVSLQEQINLDPLSQSQNLS